MTTINDTYAPLLSVEHLSVAYTTERGLLYALNDVSLAVGRGRALGLAGESGSGKSTAALAVLDLLGTEASVEGAAIRFSGRDLLRLPQEQRRQIRGASISIVFQDPFSSLNPSIPVGRQVAEPLVFHKGVLERAAIEQAVELLAQVGIPRPEVIAKSYPHQLSGGMQQRALIATALACEPELLILDEPTTALDVTIEAQILDLLEKLRSERQLAILFISHNLGVVGRLCDEVCILYAGKVLERGPTREVFTRPLHPYTKGLMASLPRLDLRARRKLTPIPGKFPDLVNPPPGCIFHPRCPFVEDQCRRDDQAMLAQGDAREARCWKAQQIAGCAFETGSSPAFDPIEPPHSPGETLVWGRDLRKEYRTGGFFDALRWKRRPGGRGLPRIVYEPQQFAALDGVSLRIGPGEVVGLVGESGCGKTTLGRTLLRLLDPTSGEVVLGGREITRMPQAELREMRKLAQIVFQNPDSSLNPRKTVEEIVGRPIKLFGLAAGTAVKSRVAELLEMVQLSPAYAERYPHQMSGGEKQRVGIARALATSPRFIVCDEAVSALDVSVQAAVLNLLDELRRELDLAYLFITHDLSVVAHLASRIVVMYRGGICEEGMVTEVLSPPYHPYTEALLSAVPKVGGSGPRIRLRGDAATSFWEVSGCRFHPRCHRFIGDICVQKAPPVQEPSPGHRLACHHPLAVLSTIPPVVGSG
jgi:peptide/nickel transport system ATP-binding protein